MSAADAGGVGAARADDHVLAGARVDVAGALRAGAGRPCGGRERDRGVRAGPDGRRPALRGRGAAAVRGGRRGRRDPARRLVGARLRPDLRARRRRRRRGGRAVRLQRLGREVRPYDEDARFATRVLETLGERATRRDAPRPRGRLDLGRRRGHADHDRAVPARGAPQPAARARGDRGGAARRSSASSGSSGSASGSSRTRTPTATSTTSARSSSRARSCSRRWPTRPTRTTRDARTTCAGCARRASRSSSCPGCPTSRAGARRRRAVHELLHLQRRPDRPERGEETDAEALALLESLYPGREAVAVAGETLALGRRRGPLHHAAGPRRLSAARAPGVDEDVVDLPVGLADRGVNLNRTGVLEPGSSGGQFAHHERRQRRLPLAAARARRRSAGS